MTTHTETTIGGRPCVVSHLGRVRRKVGRGFYNLMSIRFTDNGEYHSMGGAEFAKWSTRLDREAKQEAVAQTE
jgi:hypothetical protein